MSESAVERPTGVLVIRVWLENEVEQGALRARITKTVDVSKPSTSETAAKSPEEIVAAVEDWLRAFVEASTKA
jgi:hypothetical protein